MKKMSEDELKIKLEQVKDFLNKNEEHYAEDLPIYMFWRKEDVEAIETILDLYKQKKEKIEAMNKGIDELVREKQDLKTELYMNSVSKDKIRDKIYQLNTSDILEDQIAITYLKELLEEN